MANYNKLRKKTNKRLWNIILIIIIIILLVGIPLLIVDYQSNKTGLTWSEVILRLQNRSDTLDSFTDDMYNTDKGEVIDFLDPVPIGQEFTNPPQISHLQPADLDGDELLDVVVCDALNNHISWIQQYPEGIFTEKVLASDLIAPAHVQVIDFDTDGDKDLLVAVLGMLFPNNDKIGSVVILENDGNLRYLKHVIVEKIARVSDVRGGDLDNDGDMDMAVAQFGYDDGETRWIENLGNWNFKSHILQTLSGPVNVEILDIDLDEDMDIISLVSQEWEEIYCFLNEGEGKFQPKLLYGSSNDDFGSSSFYISDVDRDGDEDILYTNGEAFDYLPPVGRPWHGVNWLENQGNLKFTFHRICNFSGAYNCRPYDVDNDNDIDLFVVSAFNFWDRPESKSFIWLENTGDMKFIKHDITNTPTHILCLEPGDFNKDGITDFVTGGMHIYPPYDRMGRVTLWVNNGSIYNIKKQY